MNFVDTDSAVFVLNEDCSVSRYRQGLQEELYDLLYDFSLSNYLESIEDNYVKMEKSDASIYIRWQNSKYRLIADCYEGNYFLSIPEAKFESMLSRLHLLDERLQQKLSYVRKGGDGIWEADRFSKCLQDLSMQLNSQHEDFFDFRNNGMNGVIICKKGMNDLLTSQYLNKMLADDSFVLNCELMGIRQIIIIDSINATAKKIMLNR